MALIEFKNLPDTTTPLNASNLNNNFSELNTNIGNVDTKVGVLSNLNTTTKTNTVSAINEVNGKIVETYSTNEVKTNQVWIDGKPIYRKVYTVPFADGVIVNNNIPTGLTNIDIAYINSGHSFLVNSQGYIVQMGFYSTSTDWTRAYVGATKTVIGVNMGTSYSSGAKTAYITLEYTKTTD